MPIVNDFVLNVATVNGSGSQSSNNIILKTLFRMGIPVGGKNLFPSNIAGLPTWFSIRVSEKGYTGRKKDNDITVAMNLQTIAQDIQELKPQGVLIFNDDLKFDRILLRKDTLNIPVPFRSIVDGLTKAIKLKKFLTNMVYVGVVAELMGLDMKNLKTCAKDQFGNKNSSILEDNMKAIDAGAAWAREWLNTQDEATFPYQVKALNKTQGQILIDGNTAAALGLIYGGCTFVSWYPITPSSSLAEAFSSFAEKYRQDEQGKNTYAVVQAEDELSAIGMVLGAGWTGARAMTATSGPGISLMSEFAGYSYYAEIPAVIWDIQRAGPSTGLPTRTSQGDISFVANLSHGDTKQVMLFPASPSECFEFAQTAFDVADRLQTIVFVMSDLDLGMNFWMDKKFQYPTKAFDRGKTLSASDLEKRKEFHRYEDSDGDGIPYRTLPGTQHPLAPFFTRGSGHDEKARYTESSETYERVLLRLKKKWETARQVVPAPIVHSSKDNEVGVITYGSTDVIMKEVMDQLIAQDLQADYLRIRAYPFHPDIQKFIQNHKRIYVVEQNRDGQMKGLLTQEYGALNPNIHSVLHFDGLPIYADAVCKNIQEQEKGALHV